MPLSPVYIDGRCILSTSSLLAADLMTEHPDLESEDIRACLRFASERLNHPVLAVDTHSSAPAARCCAP